MKANALGISRRVFIKTSAMMFLYPMLGCSNQQPQQIIGEPMHHTTEGFRNYPVGPEAESPGFSFFTRRMQGSFNLPDIPQGHIIPEDEAVKCLDNLTGSNSITWLGHSCFLLQVNGKRILTDPFLTKCASPLPLGPTRYSPPGISIKNLPSIDIIVLSHNHYDHLDVHTIEQLPGKKRITVFVPLGLKSYFLSRGYTKVHELDWHKVAECDGICFTSLPAVHFSGRGLGDKNETLWCSWAITTKHNRYYFAGDTAYSPSLFKKIGKEYGSFDLAMIPIGAYEPKKTMQPVHTNPEEAIRLGLDINADLMVASHWGTIELTDEPHWEPAERFSDYAGKSNIGSNRAVVMKIGESKLL